MSSKDFVYTSKNDGTCFIRPITARAEVFWQSNNFFKYVIDNTEDYYIIKAVDGPTICDSIRQNGMDFTS